MHKVLYPKDGTDMCAKKGKEIYPTLRTAKLHWLKVFNNTKDKLQYENYQHK